MKNLTTEDFKKEIGAGLKYPWGKASRLWNILWVLIPIFGWLALAGYCKKIVRSLVKGDTKKLPAMDSFGKSFVEGLVIMVFLIPTMLVLSMLAVVPMLGSLLTALASMFLLPWLVINFFVKETFNSLWEVQKAYEIVSKNIIDYLFVLLKTIVYIFVYTLLSAVLVGIPCLAFGRAFFMADFYRRRH